MKQEGSIGMAMIIGVMALSFAAYYAANISSSISHNIKRYSLETVRSESQMNSLSNLSLLRGALNNKNLVIAGKTVYEPAFYPKKYFSKTNWQFAPNTSVIPTNTVKVASSADGNPAFAVKSFPVLKLGPADYQDLFTGSVAAKLTSEKELVIMNRNRKTGAYNYIESIDVLVKNSTSAAGATSPAETNMMGRISLLVPKPGPAHLEIKPSSAPDSAWGTDFGTAAKALDYGTYNLRVVGGGVTLYATIQGPGDGKITLGIDANGEIIHEADNIKAKDVVIGTVPDPVQLGSKIESPLPEPVALPSMPAPAPAPSSGGADFIITQQGCAFYPTPNAAAGVPMPAPATPSPSPSVPVATPVAATPVALPQTAQVKITLQIYGVDELVVPGAAGTQEITIFVTNLIPPPPPPPVAVAGPGVSSPKPGPGYDGNNCQSHCPMDQFKATNPGYIWTMFQDASTGGGGDPRRLDFMAMDETNAVRALGAKATVCYNYENTAAYLNANLGYNNPSTFNVGNMEGNVNDAGQWQKFNSLWNGASAPAKAFERYVAYVAPTCDRQFVVGNRGGTCGCFEESTRIRMADGTELPITDVRQGDWVWNPKTGKPQAVKRMIAGPEKKALISVTIHEQTVVVTTGHPFLTDKGMAPAMALKVGDVVIDQGTAWPITAIGPAARDEGSPDPVVWNLELEGSEHDDDHFVQADGIMTGDLYLQLKLTDSAAAKREK